MPTQHSSSTLLPSTRMTSMDKRTLIFSLSKRLLDSPHKHIGLLRELLELCDDEQQTIRRLALLSAVAVLRDLLPGYRIRLPTEKELRVQVSQEVEALRRYEKQLLDGYEHVVLTLRKWLGTAGAQRVAAARGVCALLVKARDFNCRDQLVEAVVKLCDAADAAVRRAACAALLELFDVDVLGEASLHAVNQACALRRRTRATLPAVEKGLCVTPHHRADGGPSPRLVVQRAARVVALLAAAAARPSGTNGGAGEQERQEAEARAGPGGARAGCGGWGPHGSGPRARSDPGTGAGPRDWNPAVL
jgi:hypothetical protein